MSLKDAINNTNKQKENVKTVANKIDNKLVELGGEQAVNLADVPNKIGAMVNTQYVKIAEGTYNSDLIVNYDSNLPNREDPKYAYVDINIPISIDFEPERVILRFEYMRDGEVSTTSPASYKPYTPFNLSIDSKHSFNNATSCGAGDRSNNTTKAFIKSMSRDKIVVSMNKITGGDSYRNERFIIAKPIKWTAIG